MKNYVKSLSDDDITVLSEFYKPHIPYASHIVSMFNTYFKWKKMNPNQDYMQFFVFGDEWKTSGTFVMKFDEFDLVLFTMDQSGNHLRSLLANSDILKVQYRAVLYGVRNEHLPPLDFVLHEQGAQVDMRVECMFYWISKEKAINYSTECPDEVYMANLDTSHSQLIADCWPHRFQRAVEYVSLLIQTGGGVGVFLKNGDKLVSWVLRNHWGTLVILETLPEYKRKGYATLVTKELSRRIAEDGNNPLCTIVVGNTSSETMFKKLGFEHAENCTFVVLNDKIREVKRV